MTERLNYNISCGSILTSNFTSSTLRVTTTTPITSIIGTNNILYPISQVTQNSAGTLEIGVASGNENFAPGARSGDAIIRSAENRKILLQTGAFNTSIVISTAGNVAIGNTSVGVSSFVYGGTAGFERKLDIRGAEGVSISSSTSIFDSIRYGLLQVVADDAYMNTGSGLVSFIRAGINVIVWKIDTGSNFIIQHGGSGGVFLNPSGGTSWGGVSDKRLKTNFEDISTPVSKVCNIKGTYYKFLTDNENQQRRVGVIAQDVQTVLPEAVSTTGDGKLGVNYTDLIPLMIEAIKEQKQEMNRLKQFIKSKTI